MGDILSVNTNQSCISQQESWIDTSMFLQKDNYLGEFSNEAPSEDGGTIDEKALARLNLEVYSKVETDDSVQQAIEEELNAHINANDPHKDRAYTDSRIQDTNSNFNNQLDILRTSLERLINNVQNILTRDYATVNQLNNFVKKDGSTPFTNPQKGVNPTNKYHLATKDYVDKTAEPKIEEYLNSNEFSSLINQISNSLIQELVSQSISNLQTTLYEFIDRNISEITSNFNENISEITSNIDDIELVTAKALNDLNSRTSDLQDTADDIINNIISELQSNVIDNELAISAALNNLNSRILEIDNNLDIIKPKVEFIPNRITVSGKALSNELTQKETKFLELLFNDNKVYNLFQAFSNYAPININIIPDSESRFNVVILIGDTSINAQIIYNQQNQPECTIETVTSDDPLVNNFISINGTIIKDFLETIDKSTYTNNFID